MALIINNNMMAMTAARNLGVSYDALAVSTARLSSGLRINTAADDAAGLAVRETMRADIAVLNQGVRNAGDAISLIQTAEGALQVIDEKLIRMKELAEQAATGTYTTTQRGIMNSEYQQMASEIDRIANATDFNGVKLLNGELSSATGLKIHFGTGNESAEDYYYISIANMKATDSAGLGVGGTQNLADVWKHNTYQAAVTNVVGADDDIFAFQYDADADGTNQLDEWVGFYETTCATTLTQLQNMINDGPAARITVDLTKANDGLSFHVGGETYVFGSAADGLSTNGKYYLDDIATTGSTVTSLAEAINGVGTGFWAVQSGTYLAIYGRSPGLAGNNVEIYADGTTKTSVFFGSGGAATVSTQAAGTANHQHLAHGGETWATASIENVSGSGYRLVITGATLGSSYDINFAYSGSIDGPGNKILENSGKGALQAYDAVSSSEWAETQDAVDGNAGGTISTQTDAQLALDAINSAIESKDTTRANLGALANRLENTITNLTVQAENLQAAESRISDVDVATEMTNFTRNNILVQAAVAMLAQANALPQLALQLLGG